jgi:hypothetical protein
MRAQKRAGFGVLRGALNPKMTLSVTAPNSPSKYDIWIDTSTDEFNYWDGADWVTLSGGGGTTPPGTIVYLFSQLMTGSVDSTILYTDVAIDDGESLSGVTVSSPITLSVTVTVT